VRPDDFPRGYEPRRELGEGSMGVVWLAQSRTAGGLCAVKVLHLRDDRRGSAERSFNREVRAMARLSHPSVAEILDYGRTPDGSPFVAMEYVPGTPLDRYVHEPWTWPALWTVLDALLAGLAHAHARDLIHRDLKPGNVLVLPGVAGLGALKLVDFGIALAVSDAASASRRIEGTPAYIAPEAASGDVAAVGPWTDLYSLGVMIFELLTGELPYHGRHLLDHHRRSPIPPVVLRADVEAPAALAPIVERLLAKSPVSRFRSVAGVRTALAALGPAPALVALGQPPHGLLDDELPADSADPLPRASGPAGPGLVHLREPPIAGREAAQAVLRRAAGEVLNGAGPRVVLIEGEAGIGKSRLAAWTREWAEETGRMRALVVRSEPHVRAGGGLRQAVLRHLGVPTASRADAEQALAATFADADRRHNAVETLWFDGGNDGPASEAHIVRGARLIRDLAGDAPFLLWADDAQWSPEGKVLRLIHRLAQPDGPPHLLMIVTLRPSQRTTVRAARKALIAQPCVDHIELDALSPAALEPALEALGPLPPGIAAAACMQAAGNPLIALEALRGFVEDEGLSPAPTDPNAVLQARINNATRGPDGGALRSALARATLLGRSFTIGPLTRLCAVSGDPEAPSLPADPDGLEALLERAVESGLAVEQGPGRWRFSHDLVRGQLRHICRQLPNWPPLNLTAARLRSRRAEADSTGVELEVVARHYYQGGDLDAAFQRGLQGLQRLHGAGLMGHAVSFTRRLLEWDDGCQHLSASARCELRLLGSDAAEHAGQTEEAERHAEAALGIARRNELPALASRAASRLGLMRIRADMPAEAEMWLEEALRFARRSADLPARSQAHLCLGQFYQHLHRFDQAQAAYEASLEGARGGELPAETLAARTAIAQIERLTGRPDVAEADFARIAEDAARLGLEVAGLSARLELGLCAWIRGDNELARASFKEVREGARGNLFALEFYACLGEAWSHADRGQWTEVELLLLQADDLRYDVRLNNTEAELLRHELRDLAIAARRPDIVERVARLEIMLTRTHSTGLVPGRGRVGPSAAAGSRFWLQSESGYAACSPGDRGVQRRRPGRS